MTTNYAKTISIKNAPRLHSEESKKKFRTELKKMYEEERQLVKGRFLCFEPRGGGVQFIYRKYPWEQPVEYTFSDGEEYEIPLGVARHLNGIDITATQVNGQINTCSYPVHQHQQDNMGNASINVGKQIRRYAFQTISGETLG